MRMVGVIAEYNPFHLGHAYNLQRAKEAAGASCVAVVMSTCFTQRGTPAVLLPSVRAKMALESGADAVFSLPVLWSVRDAEHYALAGIELLDQIGCDAVAFGAESDDLPFLEECAMHLEHPSDETLSWLHHYLDAGCSHPEALSRAVNHALPGAGRILSAPNNTLAICYLRAMIRLRSHMRPFVIKRIGHYHATALSETLPSATAVRGALFRGDWHHLRDSLPQAAYKLLLREAQNHRIVLPCALDQAMLYRMRTMTDDEWQQLPDLSEGLQHRLCHAARATNSMAKLLEAAATKRYPMARLQRMCVYALLHISQQDVNEVLVPPAAHLLGMRRDTIGAVLSSTSIAVLHNMKEYAGQACAWVRVEDEAYNLIAMQLGYPCGLLYQQKMVCV